MHKFIIFLFIVALLYGCTNKERQSKLQDDDKDMVGDSSSDQLVGTCWLLKTNAKDRKTWMRFYRSTIFYDEIIDSEIIEERSGNRISKSCYKTDYYISDHMPTKFDKSLVGKRTSGRYLVEERQAGGTRCLEIYMLIRGYKAAVEKTPELDAIRRWLGSDTLRITQPRAVNIARTPVLIDSVEVLGVSGREADYVRKKLKVHAGDRVSRADVEDALNTIFGKGSYEYVSYDMLGKEEPFRLRVNCKRGPKNLLGVGFRMDTEELVSLLLNVGLNTTAMRGSSLDMTARLGANPYLDLHYAYETPQWPTFNVRADLRWTDHNNFLMGENRFNVGYLSTKQEVYASNMEWSNFDVKGGLQNTFFNIAHLLASDVVGDYDRSLWKMDYPGVFVDATAYTLDDGYFPRQGFSAHLRYDLLSRVFDGPDYPGFFGIVSGSGQMPVPIGRRFTLSMKGGFRFIFGDDIPIPFANVLGGEMLGRYVDHQLPFIGINNAAFRRNNLVVLRTDFRYEFLRNNYITAAFNYSRDFYSFRQFETGVDLFGCGLGYAYDTVVGPLKAIVHWSSMTRKVGAYLSLGFDF